MNAVDPQHPPTDFALLERGRTRMWIRRGHEASAELLGLVADPPAVGWAEGGRARHPIVALPGGEHALLRAYRRGGAVRRVNRERYFGGHRAFEELCATEAAREAGVRVPTVLAATERRHRVGYTASLATRWIPRAVDLESWLRRAAVERRRVVWREAGRQIDRMHARGIAHPDLNLGNLLVAEVAAGLPTVYVLDFDRARFASGAVSPQGRAADLSRLARSARKLGLPLTPDDAFALREGYGGRWPDGARLP